MQRREASPLTLFHIRDLEALDVAVDHGASALELFRAKVADPDYAEMSFYHFLHLRGDASLGRHSRWHEARWHEIMRATGQYFRGLGIPERDPDE